jgi:TPP-dependent pyruvate/acetoin dehydrogenase alpha subunit
MKHKSHVDVLELRGQQHIINELMKLKKLKINPHMAFGHEANAVAIQKTFNKKDNLILTHRNIAFNLAFEKNSLKKFIDEFNLKNTGINKGKNGSMNIINPHKGILYTSSILGNNFSIALGISIKNKIIDKNNNFTLVVTGDGALEEGSFTETLIISRKFSSRLIILIENNNFAMASTILQRRNEIKLKKVAEAYDLNYLKLSNRDVNKYISEINKFKKKILINNKPGIIEFETKMYNNHAGATPGWPTDQLNININNGLEIEKTNNDPAFVSKNYLSDKLIKKITLKIKKINTQFSK